MLRFPQNIGCRGKTGYKIVEKLFGAIEIWRRCLDPVLRIPIHMINTGLAAVNMELSHVVNTGHIRRLFPQLGLLVHVMNPSFGLQLHVSLWRWKERRIFTVFQYSVPYSLVCSSNLLVPKGRRQPAICIAFWQCFKRSKSVRLDIRYHKLD